MIFILVITMFAVVPMLVFYLITDLLEMVLEALGLLSNES